MKTHFLTADRQKQLQLDPGLAREQRVIAQSAARRALEQGNNAQAFEYTGEAFEIARTVILSLHNPATSTQTLAEDFLAYGALALYMASQYENQGEADVAQYLLEQSQQQLAALQPLYAAEPDIASLIRSVMQSLDDNEQPAATTLAKPH
ncbi:hypothetical protein [Salinimonas lutimaris]|uniref:hypothetical protein n=1 Tax=Salinimonas lutimaris TaxID=914153 RepID=UPI0010C0768A|nr:hypothetical protein [Salinimonas lutimaris]